MKKSLPVIGIFLMLALCGMFCASATAAENEEYKPLAFTVHTQTTGPVTVKLAPMDVVSELNVPVTLPLTISNSADTPISATLTFYSCDTVTPMTAGEEQKIVTKKIEIPAKGSVDEEFTFKMLDGTYSAHYPLHVKCDFTFSDREMEVHSVRVIETKVSASKKSFEPTIVKIGGVSLLGKSFYASRTLKDETIEMPDFSGSDPTSHCAYNFQQYTTNGDTRPCYSSHPPYLPQGGSFFAAYPVELPKEAGLTFSYGVCVRNVLPPEPPTDGVTFRFWAQEEGKERVLLDEYHTVSTVWEDRSFSVDAYAGKAFTFVVEMNPGPKNNTTCDGCFLSGMTFNSGRGMRFAESVDAAQNKPFELKLDEESSARIYPGANGLLDAKISVGNPKKPDSFVTFDGITLAVGAQSLTTSSTVFTKKPELKLAEDGKTLLFNCTLLANDTEFPIEVRVYAENGMLVFDVPKTNPTEIRNFTFRAADKTAKRVYWGHGFVNENPKKFRMGMGGHNLAASHVGMDFENGTSLLMGASNAPAAFNCDGENRIYTLEMNSWFKLALVPDYKNAFDAAVKYRKNNTWLPRTAPGVERKRGRLTYDVWGGAYAQNVEEMRKAIQYGVTDSLFVKHVWQCWGYDVRLPDIWNTNPDAPTCVLSGLGKYEELKELAELCAAHGIPFGVHDNYIDYYPDAEEFSYDYIDFHANGTPRKAWINHGAGVQSYQWRPDLFKPFLERNLALDRKYLPTMDAYFVDVFTSANVYEYYGRDGQFHPMTQTAACWKDAFETISAGLSHEIDGKNVPGITMSEAGADALLGSITGADCQWMLIDSEKGGSWRMFIPCGNWARTPWFTAVNHTNFSRHGAGYSGRYMALRDANLHNAMSDDYISAEILGGLDLMVEADTIFAGSVRKNYLAQHVVRSLADEEIEGVDFVDGNIRHQCVTWSNGFKVYVNRDVENWKVKNYLLPKYGFVVLNGKGAFLSGIVRNPENTQEIVEMSRRPDGSFYMNGRGKQTVNLLPIQPTMKSAKVLEDGKAFEVVTNWKCGGPAPKDLSIFAHVYEPRRGYDFKPTGWYDGYSCDIPTSKWGTSPETQNIETGAGHVFRVPEDARDGVYHVMVGLYDTQKRYTLMGESAQDVRYSVASFQIRDGKIDGEISPVAITETMDDFQRLVGNKTPFCWNGISTLGVIRVQPTENGLEILPLPPESEFDVTLEKSEKPVKSVICDGKDVEFTTKDGRTTFHVKVEDAKIYKVEF